MSSSERRVFSLATMSALLCVTFCALAHAAPPLRLTHDGGRKFSPVYLDTGQTVIYTLFANPTLMRLMRLNTVTGAVEPFDAKASTSEFEAEVSVDGRVMAFVQLRGVLSLALVIRDLETNRRAEVPPAPGLSGMRSPAISPDHMRVVYSFADEGRQKLYEVSSEGGTPKKITDGPGVDNWPCFSPDGQTILFSSTRDGNYDLYLLESDRKHVRRLTDHARQDIRPRFSPDGKRIALTSYRDGGAHVYVMNADGSHIQRVVTGGDRDDYPSWHPDGRKIVLVSEQNGQQDLYLADAPP